MKKKFLVPIMALAMVVTAGVNYNLIGEQMNSLKSNLADICSVSTAQAEWGYDDWNRPYDTEVFTMVWAPIVKRDSNGNSYIEYVYVEAVECGDWGNGCDSTSF